MDMNTPYSRKCLRGTCFEDFSTSTHKEISMDKFLKIGASGSIHVYISLHTMPFNENCGLCLIHEIFTFMLDTELITTGLGQSKAHLHVPNFR